MAKVPETAPTNVVDIEEVILGAEEFARRKAAYPSGVLRKVVKLTDAQKAQIRSARLLKVSELAKHFGVSATTIANIRNSSK